MYQLRRYRLTQWFLALVLRENLQTDLDHHRNFQTNLHLDMYVKTNQVSLLFQIVKEAYVDHTQFDKKDVHYDPSSKPENPKWSMVGSHDVDADQLN